MERGIADSRRILRFGEVWQVDLDPIVGHEQGGIRPAIVGSADALNAGRSGLCLVVAVTRTFRGVPFHVEIAPPNGGLKHRSYALCEMVRSISVDRARYRIGIVDALTMADIRYRLQVLLDL